MLEEQLRGRPWLLVSAHPDDETLGAAVLLQRAAAGAHVAFLTDGAPRDPRFWPAGLRGGPRARERYARRRQQEARAALALAGIPAARLHWLGGIDQEVVQGIVPLVRALRALLDELGGPPGLAAVITHPYEGGHPDHDGASVIVQAALASTATPRLEMTSYHDDDAGQLVTGRFLPAADHDGETWVIEPTGPEQQRARQMRECHASQREALAPFPLQPEQFRTAPRHDFTRPPHAGRLRYERLGWPIDGSTWRQLASQACGELTAR